MNITPVSYNQNFPNPNFGSSFRVRIVVKDGLDTFFVNPAKNTKLYKKLNSKLVNCFNEEFTNSLRTTFGIPKKKPAKNILSDIQQRMIDELKRIDKDFREFNLVRSVYRKNQLGFIATGSDVSILENIKGLGQIGLAKRDSLWANGYANNAYVRGFSKNVQQNAINYVESDNVLLRSGDNKEIMLNAIFKQTGLDKKGKPVYELDSYEFHKNASLPNLAPVSEKHLRYKNSSSIRDEIQKTVQFRVNTLLKKKVHFSDIENFLKSKPEKTVVKPSEKVEVKNVVPEPKKVLEKKENDKGKQLTIDFGI